ncbi:MAG: histidinol-phosphate aminotransferase [Steroidobacteraceae bacterium]|nr:histidinol-phosphate aminotransferase [Steroidobacteraceae bacterium]
MANRFEQFAAPGVRRLAPYVPGKPPEQLERELGITGSIKLASNENPLGPGPHARAALAAALAGVGMYPDGSGHVLRARLAAKHKVSIGQVTLGNGSNDVLVLLAGTFLTPEHEAVYSQYAFAVYPIAVQASGAKAIIAAANPADHRMPLGHDPAAILAAIGPRTRIVFLANPNNPTGTWLTGPELEELVRGIPPEVIVVLDEAYHEYSAGMGVPDGTTLQSQFPNLVVARTFSKAFGLAGLRVGYTLSHPDIADLLNRVRQPFNVSVVGLAAAAAALDDGEHVEATLALNRRGLARLREGLAALGLAVLPSAANFLLCDLRRSAAPVSDALLRRGVIVRPVVNYGLPNHLRISTGTAEQNERVLAAMAAALAEGA